MAKVRAGRAKRKVMNIDADVRRAIEDMVRDGEGSFDELAGRALRDFRKKQRRSITLQDALRQSTEAIPANDRGRRARR